MKFERILFKLRYLDIKHKIVFVCYTLFPFSRRVFSNDIVFLNDLLNYCFENKVTPKFNGKFIEIPANINNSNGIIRLRNNSSDIPVFNQIIYHQELLPVKKILEQNKNKKLTVIDAGANIGLSTIYIKAHFNNSQIISLEPSPENLELLKYNLQKYNKSELQILEKALWNKSINLTANKEYTPQEYWCYSLCEASSDTPSSKTIPAVSIEDIFLTHKIHEIDYLKIDIEGGEKQLFEKEENYSHWLPKTRLISIEVHEQYISKKSVKAILEKNSFEVIESGELLIGTNTRF